MMFEAQQMRRDVHDSLHAEIWTPPLVFHCVTGEPDDGMRVNVYVTISPRTEIQVDRGALSQIN